MLLFIAASAGMPKPHRAGISSLEKLRSLSIRGSIDMTSTQTIHEVTECLVLTDDKLRRMMKAMEAAMDKGLAKETASQASVRMLPSYVRSVPNGTERGDFLALDLGGTNFRVLLIRLTGQEAEMTGKIFRVPDHIMKGTGEALFDHIAECMAKFMQENNLKHANALPLGFTFSFPCQQEGLTKARLINWTKGFTASGVENQDVVQLLRDACKRRGDIEIDVMAILNDTTGTLMACAFKENSCQIGIIVGTGTNACYMEKLSRCGKLDGEFDPAKDGLPDEIHEVTECLVLTDDKLRRMMKAMEAAMDKGLAKETASQASVRMLPSYVRSVPNGTERGDFLALDLGGTNFRVLLIRLTGQEAEMTGKIFRVPDHIMKGTGEALFDHIAECMAKFMQENNLKHANALPLGFTFSFPCQQEGLTKARLINWTKGFTASGVENQDVVQLLRDACKRRGDIEIDVMAILNDTTGTLMACAFKENSCQIGIIVGTGTNACYMEKLSRCGKLDGEFDPAKDGLPDEMCINTEWGAFGDHGEMDFIRTSYDDEVDGGSINKGKQLFEKMISGMYLGELVRVVLADLAKEKLLFDGDYEAISQKGCFPTKFVSEIESDLLEDDDRNFSKTLSILEDIGVENVSSMDCANVAFVCTLVSTRAAHMTAAGIAMLLNRMRKPYVTVGVDGSVYRFHPTFPRLLDQKIDELVDGEVEYQLMLSEDGSGRGAALVAAVACRMRHEAAAALQKQ